MRRLLPLLLLSIAALPLIADDPKPKEGKDRKGGEEVEFEVADGVKMVFCWIPPGKATLGSPTAEKGRSDDEKEHEYEEKTGFWMAKYPVTQAEWTAVMKTTPFYFHEQGDARNAMKRLVPSAFLGGKDEVKGLDTSRFPAEWVNWESTQDFLKSVNKRPGLAKVLGGAGSFKLPHEDAWEYACRGGKEKKTAYYWGNTLNGSEANCDGRFPYGTTEKGEYKARPTEVGSYTKATPHSWGLCDMAGNVWQWCDNYYDNDKKLRAMRGGSWREIPVRCRAASRGFDPFCDSAKGFRVMFRPD